MQNIDSDLIRGNIDTIILKTMIGGDMYGLDIIKEVENKSNGTYVLKQPTLYSCLKRLENQELISSYWLDSDIGGKRHYYKLTDKGIKELENKQKEWSKSKFIIDNLLGDFNSDDYRLVKKQDYDTIIDGKKFEYNGENETENSASPVEESATQVQEKIVEVIKYKEPEEKIIESDSYKNASDEPFFVDSGSAEQLSTKLGDGILQNISFYDENQSNISENNVLYNLRTNREDLLSTYGANYKFHDEQPTNQPEPEEDISEEDIKETEPEVIQQHIFDLGLPNDNNSVDESIDEFERNIDLLNNFQETEKQEFDDDFEEPKDNISLDNLDFNYEETEDDENNLEGDYEEDEDFSITYTEPEDISEEEPEETYNYSSSNFLDELNELGGNGYQNNYDAFDEEISSNIKSNPKTEPSTPSFAIKEETRVNIEEEEDTKELEKDIEEEIAEETYSSEPIEHIETNDELWNSRENHKTNYEDDFSYANSSDEPNPVLYENTQTSFDDIIYKNNTLFTSSNETENYNTFVPTNSNEDYKKKLNGLNTYSKVSLDNNDGIERAKDINSLKAEFEKEGIKVTAYKKEVVSDSERNYLLLNKLNIIKSFILLFGYVFLLSALYIILGTTNFKNTTGFSFICFLYGFIPFGIYALYSTIKYLLNPYKKIPAKYAPGIMFFISAIITVQLLLITYCVNLQMGFYSFSQAGYNHLNWIVPLMISFSPIVSTAIHTALFYSRNFNV